uniref:Uncharacterized protein n=1 Tax=Zea mays TaxID=4577 RepID=A0A804M3F0_MAIZE
MVFISSSTRKRRSGSGGLLFSMGLLGYIFSKSTISLVLGITPGLATLLLGTQSEVLEERQIQLPAYLGSGRGDADVQASSP